MRLRDLLLAAVLSLSLSLSLPLAGAEAATRAEVERAAETVRQHPDVGGKRKEMQLRLRPADAPPRSDDASWDWLRKLAGWLSETARVLMWILGLVAIALLVVGLRRWVQVRGVLAPERRHHAPSHVQSLDIRPESLPAAIGAAAAQLWERGEHRAALSLLYRGALSRLVHAHAVPIRAASTEGECVQLAAQRLDPQRSAFFARLVGAWQLAVYGARLPEAPQALALCREFDLHLAEGARP